MKDIYQKFITGFLAQKSNKSLRIFKISLSEVQIRLLIINIILLLVIGADLTVVLKSQLKKLGGASSKVRQIKLDINHYKKDFARLQSLNAEFNTLKSKITEAEIQIASDTDLTVFLDQKAASLDVKITQIKPIWEEAVIDNDAKAALQLYGLPINMELCSAYHKLGEFLAFIEHNPLIGITYLKIQRNNLNAACHRVSLNVKAYVRKK